jgi:hypothetical protein
LRQLRRTFDVSLEFNVIYQVLSADARLEESWVSVLASRALLRQIFICCCLQLAMQFAGIQASFFFADNILKVVVVMV